MAKKEGQVHPGGRPTKYKPEYCDEIVEFCEQGKSITQYAASIKVHRDTLYGWAETNEEFSYSLRLASQAREAYLEEMGMENMFSKDFNTKIWEMFLKCQHGWRDRDKIDNLNVNVRYEDKLKELE